MVVDYNIVSEILNMSYRIRTNEILMEICGIIITCSNYSLKEIVIRLIMTKIITAMAMYLPLLTIRYTIIIPDQTSIKNQSELLLKALSYQVASYIIVKRKTTSKYYTITRNLSITNPIFYLIFQIII